MILGGKTTEFHMNEYLPFLYSASQLVVVVIRFACRSKATPFAGEACETISKNGSKNEACEPNHSQVRTESCWEKHSPNSSVALLAAIMRISTWYLCAWGHCVGVRRAMVLIGDGRQASSEGNGWNRTNRTGGCGPVLNTKQQQKWLGIGLLPKYFLHALVSNLFQTTNYFVWAKPCNNIVATYTVYNVHSGQLISTLLMWRVTLHFTMLVCEGTSKLLKYYLKLEHM